MVGVSVIATQIAGQMAAQGRGSRRPEHRFNLITRPFQITPFMIAPVLPGETLNNIRVQSRTYTDPLKSSIIGWWNELYFFYCSHKSLPGSTDFMDMMIDPTKDMSSHERTVSDDLPNYTAIGGMEWVAECQEACVAEFFRDEGEAWDAHVIDSVPIAQTGDQSWMDSLQDDTDFVIPDVDVDLDSDATIMASEVEKALQMYQLGRNSGLIEMDYEDWLATYGVRQSSIETNTPELLRFLKEWTYPTTTVDPSTGLPRAAATWAMSERSDKKRFFKYPGFIVGFQVTRPKVYYSLVNGNAAAFMNDHLLWLPAVLTNDFRTSMRNFTAGTGPLPGNTDDYWIDMRDLLMYGDQFCNFDISASPKVNKVPLPTAAGQKKYVLEADLDNLFASPPSLESIFTDGVVRLDIKSYQRDQSITT